MPRGACACVETPAILPFLACPAHVLFWPDLQSSLAYNGIKRLLRPGLLFLKITANTEMV